LPLYEYECPKCGTFELVRKFSDAPLKGCPTCASPVEKLASAPAIQFKGTGWYITDYARKPSGGEGGKEGKDKGGAGDSAKDKGGTSTPKDSGGTSKASPPTPGSSWNGWTSRTWT